jgi:23S rRNA (adenine2503-C2)-methyltransferase
LEILKKYTRKAKRKIFYEYVMLKWVNDMENEAESLWKLLKWEMAHINIIPYNPWWKDDYSCSEKETMWKFQKIFEKYEIPSTIRVTLGQDIDWACGQLATK